MKLKGVIMEYLYYLQGCMQDWLSDRANPEWRLERDTPEEPVLNKNWIEDEEWK